MNDMRATIVPKSDQINADDLIGGPMTIRVTKVLLTVTADQPVSIGYEDDNDKPYRPCKSMRRVLVTLWGPDANAYEGRSMTLYRDDKVQFGGLAVGGIRISHMSHIDKPQTMALTATRANRKPFTVKPLVITTPARPAVKQQVANIIPQPARSMIASILKCQTVADIDALAANPRFTEARDNLRADDPVQSAMVDAEWSAAFGKLYPQPDEAWGDAA